MKTAISIPDQVFNSAERFAKSAGVSRSELYTTALRKFLDEKSTEKITEQLNAVYEQKDSNLEKEIHLMQTRSLPKEEW